MKEQLSRPLPWAFVAATALVAALVVPAGASGGLFWGLTGLCCLGTALAVWFAGVSEA